MLISCSYFGTFSDYSGYGDANRMDITALYRAGINLTTEVIRQVPEKKDYGLEEQVALGLLGRDINHKIRILHVTPDMYPRYLERGKYNISRLIWETDKIPNVWIAACNDMDEVWSASEQMSDIYRNSGVKVPITAIPEPIDITDGFENIKKFQLKDVSGKYLFYSIFQWIDRKNPKGLLTAYWKAFEKREDVGLILKTYGVNYAQGQKQMIKDQIAGWKKELGLKLYPPVYFVSDLLTDREMKRLHATGDCFINSSSAEGWCRPMQEAMLYGKPVISGSNGGITDHMYGFVYYLCPSEVQRVTEHPSIPWYTKDQNWKVLKEDDLIQKMLIVYGNREEAKQVGERGKKFVVDHFNFEVIGKLMKDRLETIYEEKGY